jgi:hypothetical protein
MKKMIIIGFSTIFFVFSQNNAFWPSWFPFFGTQKEEKPLVQTKYKKLVPGTTQPKNSSITTRSSLLKALELAENKNMLEQSDIAADEELTQEREDLSLSKLTTKEVLSQISKLITVLYIEPGKIIQSEKQKLKELEKELEKRVRTLSNEILSKKLRKVIKRSKTFYEQSKLPAGNLLPGEHENIIFHNALIRENNRRKETLPLIYQ